MSLTPKKVRATLPCPISGSDEVIEISHKDRHGSPLRNVMSVNSGLIYVDPVPFENTEEFYKTDYRKSYKGVHRPKPKHVCRAGKIAMQRYSRLVDFLPDSALCLDAGSSSGEFVYLLNSKGFNARGVEANFPYAEYSKAELGIPVSITPFSEFESEQKFDLISMFHVLEHLEYPLRDLSSLKKFLKPEGYFVIEVPNILYANMAFSHKWHPGHLFSFTDKTLSLLMEKAGFRTVYCSPINDGGNIWGVFKHDSGKSKDEIKDNTFIPNPRIDLLKARAIYHLRFWNYFKFLNKAISQIREKLYADGKDGKEILDELYG